MFRTIRDYACAARKEVVSSGSFQSASSIASAAVSRSKGLSDAYLVPAARKVTDRINEFNKPGPSLEEIQKQELRDWIGKMASLNSVHSQILEFLKAELCETYGSLDVVLAIRPPAPSGIATPKSYSQKEKKLIELVGAGVATNILTWIMKERQYRASFMVQAGFGFCCWLQLYGRELSLDHRCRQCFEGVPDRAKEERKRLELHQKLERSVDQEQHQTPDGMPIEIVTEEGLPFGVHELGFEGDEDWEEGGTTSETTDDEDQEYTSFWAKNSGSLLGSYLRRLLNS